MSADRCIICGQVTPTCRCDLAWLDSRVQLDANHTRWVKETRELISKSVVAVNAGAKGGCPITP
jgi:hypothetical protein